MDLRLYFKKRKVEAESSASIKEGGDKENEENREADDREEIEILEEDQEARQEMPYFLDYSAPLFSLRPRIDRALCPGLRVIPRALESTIFTKFMYNFT